MGNLHYVLAPAGIIRKKDLAPRWGLLSYGDGGFSVIVKADGQECARTEHVGSAIARTLNGDIYRADDRAVNSVNREIFAQQEKMTQRIRAIRQNIVLAPAEKEARQTSCQKVRSDVHC